MIEPEIVCFCDIPFDQLSIHCSKDGPFGLAFSKDFLIEQGAASVMYVALGDPVFTQLDEFVPSTGQTNWQKAAKGPRAELLGGVVHFHNWLHYQETFLLESVVRGATTKEAVEKIVEDLRTLLLYQVAIEAFLLGHVKFFDSSLSETDPNNFYMEREWRVAGKVRFKPTDIAQVIVPPEFVDRARRDMPEIADRVMPLDAG